MAATPRQKQKNTYRTAARELLLEFFSRNPDVQFTAEALCDKFSRESKAMIAKSTLYRQLSRLCEEQLLQKFDGTDTQTGAPVRYYQARKSANDCANHFHLKCTACGALQHLECERTEVLTAHILQTHDFTVDCGSSILYGLCHACAGRLPHTTVFPTDAQAASPRRHKREGCDKVSSPEERSPHVH